MILSEINWGGELWRVGTVYVRENIEKVLEKIRREINERKGEKGWILGGDFNARIGEEGALEDRELGVKRRSVDKTVNKQGEKLLNWVEEEEWGILNEAKEGDKKGEVTFIRGRGESVIEVLGNRMAWERIGKLEVGGEIDSDHRSVTVSVERGIRRGKREIEGRKAKGWIKKEIWSVEAEAEFGERTEELELGEEGINEKLEELIEKIKESVMVKRYRGEREKRESGGM